MKRQTSRIRLPEEKWVSRGKETRGGGGYKISKENLNFKKRMNSWPTQYWTEKVVKVMKEVELWGSLCHQHELLSLFQWNNLKERKVIMPLPSDSLFSPQYLLSSHQAYVLLPRHWLLFFPSSKCSGTRPPNLAVRWGCSSLGNARSLICTLSHHSLHSPRTPCLLCLCLSSP